MGEREERAKIASKSEKPLTTKQARVFDSSKSTIISKNCHQIILTKGRQRVIVSTPAEFQISHVHFEFNNTKSNFC